MIIQPLARISELPCWLRLHCRSRGFCLALSPTHSGYRRFYVLTTCPLKRSTLFIIILFIKLQLYPHLNPAYSLKEQSDQRWIQRHQIHFVPLSYSREICWVSILPNSTAQLRKWMLLMPGSLSSSCGSMIFSGRLLTGVPSSALVFLLSPNHMPTIHRFTMVI